MTATTPGGGNLLAVACEQYYPNPTVLVEGVPVRVFRDHRWTVPVLDAAQRGGLLGRPATLITFDRHGDFLDPVGGSESLAAWAETGDPEELGVLVRDHLSPRDDDWIAAGMELGLIGDCVQFRSEEPEENGVVTHYRDRRGILHRRYILHRPARELNWHGALADPSQAVVCEGLWTILGWDPARPETLTPAGGYILDIDLDFFTIGWEQYILPFNATVMEGEFHTPRQWSGGSGPTPGEVLAGWWRGASCVTVATEPGFCGGATPARHLFGMLDRLVFGGALTAAGVRVSPRVRYPEA